MVRLGTIGALGSMIAMSWASSAACAGLPFDTLAGTWSGPGSLAYDSGAPDKLECLGYYRASGGSNALSIALRCKGDSNFELRAKLNYDGGKLAGTWEERTYNASGEASGDASDSKISLKFTGSLDGSMSIDYSQSTQTVSVAILTAQSELKSAKFDLVRH
jgi:hypothetical protein